MEGEYFGSIEFVTNAVKVNFDVAITIVTSRFNNHGGTFRFWMRRVDPVGAHLGGMIWIHKAQISLALV